MALPEIRSNDLAAERRCFSVTEFARRNSISRSRAFFEIRSGRLEARKVGRRTIITIEAEAAWLAALPVVRPASVEAV
jgi:hypothetical protein